jgi:plastocyanin
VLATVAAVPVWRRDDDGGRRARVVWLAVAGLIVVAGVVGAVATMAYESEAAQAGDLMLVARGVEFKPADVSAEAGQVAVFVENADALWHTLPSTSSMSTWRSLAARSLASSSPPSPARTSSIARSRITRP